MKFSPRHTKLENEHIPKKVDIFFQWNGDKLTDGQMFFFQI